jgi:hypothetical protein
VAGRIGWTWRPRPYCLEHNLTVVLRPAALPVTSSPWATLRCWFTLEGIELLQMDETASTAADDAWIDGVFPELRLQLLPRMLSPFKYNLRLHGVRASDFFGDVGTWLSVRLARVGDHHLLLARKL